MIKLNIKIPPTTKSKNFFFKLTFRENLSYTLSLVFNHTQDDYIETLPVTGDQWLFENVTLDFVKQSKMEKMTVCLSSTSVDLLMFPNASQKCTEIVNSICKDQDCKEEDISKAPQINIVFNKYEFKFFGHPLVLSKIFTCLLSV